MKDKLLCLVRNAGKQRMESGSLVLRYDHKAELEKAVQVLEEIDELRSVYLCAPDLEELWSDFKGMFTFIEAAGGIVKSPEGSILFIKRNGKWDLPKGKLERGEAPDVAAMREVEEECGISGLVNESFIGNTYHTYNSDGTKYLKSTHWYAMDCDNSADGVPQAEEGITEVKWSRLSEIDGLLENTYASLKDLLSRYLSD